MKKLLICTAFLILVNSSIVEFSKTSVVGPFVEQFTEGWEKRWRASEAMKDVPEQDKDNDNLDEQFRYRGEWIVTEAQKNAIDGDVGLLLKTPAAHSAISALFSSPINPAGKTLVIQYDVKLQDDLSCGGAYIKLLSGGSNFDPKTFSDKTPYTIMFGPDKCGTTDKVHFIFRHQHDGKAIEEKHMTKSPRIKSGKDDTTLYTLIVTPDQKFKLLINNEVEREGSLLEDFDPSVNPPKEIDDSTDSQPDDWVTEPQIKDPTSTKPDDWDEEAPAMIVDEKAVKPEDWLEDETEYVADPEAIRPEDWSDEEDGEWLAPQIPNPKCQEVSGCGPWSRPQIANPNYRGKWHPAMIPNPDYKGPWKPRKIPNPDYYEDLNPAKFTTLAGIGLELWTMQGSILFDNFYIGHSEADAKKLASETWEVKRSLEKAAAEKAGATAESSTESTSSGSTSEKSEDVPEFTTVLKKNVEGFVSLVQVDPLKAFGKYPVVGFALLLALVAPLFVLGFLGKSSDVEKPGKKKEEKSETTSGEVADDEADTTSSTVRKRKVASKAN